MKRGLSVVLLLLTAGVATAGPMDDGLELLGAGKLEEALVCFDRELRIRPANTEAYMYAGMTAERIPDLKRARRYWERLLKIATDPTEREMARTHLVDCDRKKDTPPKTSKTKTPDSTAPKTDTPASAFDHCDDQFYKVTTKHFMVMAKNPGLARKAAEEGERHLRRICAAFLRGQLWPRVISVYIYRDHTEYVRERGLPDWSGGGYSYIRYSADNQVRVDQNGIPIHDVGHVGIAHHYHVHGYPLFGVNGWGRGGDAVIHYLLPVDAHVGPGSTDVCRGSVVSAISAQELGF